MTNNIKTLKDTECTGCGACLNVCPVGAISMLENSEGFLYPQIDEEKCMNCGLCKKTCPAINPNYKNNKSPECYAYMASDEERLKSSSGGAFPVLAHWFINNGGYVAGAVWTKDYQVEHIVSNNLDDIERMRNSKYLQSDTKNCYKEIKQLLEDDKKVLFTGTPCQVAGLKLFLQKDYNELYCVDVICHGVPSPKIFKKYIDENYDRNEIKSINLRAKHLIGVRPWHVEIGYSNNKEYILTGDDIFYKAFLYDIALRKSCTNCNFAKLPRQGDITIGDFWGIELYDKHIDDKKGVSVLLSNNKQGETLLKVFKQNKKFIKKVPLKYSLKKNPQIYKPVTPHKNRDMFFDLLDKESLKDTLDYCLNDKCDCMIINYWSAKNYGAILTCFGLQTLLENLNKKTKVINFVPEQNKSNKVKTFSQKFAEKYLNLTKECNNYDDLINLNNCCNAFITGSDQVFNFRIMRGESNKLSPYIYLLDFVNSKNKKLSFSASTGFFYKLYNNEVKLYMEHFLKQFDEISVREFEAQKILKNEFDLDSTQIIDPVFNIPKDKLYNMCSKYDDKYQREKYVGYFGLQYWKDNWEFDLAKKISEKLNLPLKIMDFNVSTDVEEWLSFIKNSEFFISNSYHGIAFSIIFNRPFVQAINVSSQERFNSLFKLLEIENNSVSKFDIINWDELLTTRDWEKINKIIKEETTRSSEWLKNALSKEHIQTKNNQDVINYQIAKSIILKNALKQKRIISLKYIKYKILSKILFGKKRKYYKNKRIKFKNKIKELKKYEQ